MKQLHHRGSESEIRQMPGFALKFLATGDTTNGAYDLLEAKGRKGAEPGLHFHKNEDEAFFMLEGEMTVTIGEERFHVRRGDFIFLPRNIPHKQEFITNTIHVILLINPAGYAGYFRDLSQPAEKLEPPALPPRPPSEEIMQKLKQINEKYEVTMVEE